jgi:hypothetical protein
MSLADIIKRPLQRLVPHEGMVVDVATWNAAHDYHGAHQRLHAMTMHSPGVVAGLEVVAWDPPDSSVVINPGLAVDSEGRVIAVGEPQRFQLQTSEAGAHYLVLQFSEVTPAGAAAPANHDSQPRYLLEAYSLQERRELPGEPYVELARVQVSGRGAPISEAQDPFNPGPDEIDMRHRLSAGPQPAGVVRLGVVPLEVAADGQILHAAGATSLARATNATTPYRAEFIGSVNLNQPIAGCDLLIMAGRQEFALTDDWLLVLRRFLERGGVLLGETCGADARSGSDGAPFRRSFVALAERLGIELAIVERGHPLLKAHHLFAQAPEGAGGPASMVAGGGIVYSDGDYGCLWDGGRPNAPAQREAIRSAAELGVNMGIYASRRVHMRSVRLAAQ